VKPSPSKIFEKNGIPAYFLDREWLAEVHRTIASTAHPAFLAVTQPPSFAHWRIAFVSLSFLQMRVELVE
jgi:hypothetical protein